MEGEAGKGGAAGEAVGVGAGAKGRSSLSEFSRKVCARVECSSCDDLGDDAALALDGNPNISQQAKDALKAALPNCGVIF